MADPSTTQPPAHPTAPAPDAPPPTLPNTADAAPYVQVHWLAVAAFGVAILFALLVMLLGINAFKGKKSLVASELLLFPILTLVLCFAARRIIRNSEGTRTGVLFGLDLVTVAWWVALVGGLGYSAYLAAIEVSIRNEARREAERWVGYLIQGEPNRAFVRTLDPGRRAGMADDPAKLQAEFREQLLKFRQCDIARVTERNPGRCKFEVHGVDWRYQNAVVDCILAGTLTCPEGTFPVHVPLKGTESPAGAEGGTGRQWQVLPSEAGYIQRERIALTPFGWLMYDIELDGGRFGRSFIGIAARPGWQYIVYRDFLRPAGNPAAPPADVVAAWGAVASGIGVGLGLPSLPGEITNYRKYIGERFLALADADKLPKDQREFYRAQFRSAWDHGRIAPGGAFVSASPDTYDLVRLIEDPQGVITGVEVTVPVEIRPDYRPLDGNRIGWSVDVPIPPNTPPPSQMGPNIARGRLIMTTADPKLLAELNQLRGSADPAHGAVSQPQEPGKRQLAWRVARIETDMYMVITRQPVPGPPGPGGPGGPH